MKEGWKYKKLGEVCEIGIGRTPSRSDMSLWDKNKQTHNYWVSIADMGAADNGYITDTKEYISDKAADNIQIIPKGTLLLSFKLTLGKTAIAGMDLYTNEAIANLLFKGNEVNREFLSYYFQYFNWEKYSAGDEKVLGKTLNKKKLDVLPVYYPVPSEQQRIVSRLDSAFAHIDELKANEEKQLGEARTLFQKALTKAMEPKEGWEEKKLKDLVDENCPISYGIVQQGNHVENGVPVVRPVDLNKRLITRENLKCTTNEISDSYKRTILKGNEILLSVRGTTGVVALAAPELKGCNVNRGIVPLSFNCKVDKLFIYYEMLSPASQIIFAEKTTGSTLKQINIKDLRLIEFSFPPLSEQQRIVSRLDSLSAHVRELEEVLQKTIAECDALKQALLRKVFE